MIRRAHAGGVFDVRAAWKKAKDGFERMTPAQKKKTLVSSGILTPSGKVAKPYTRVFKSLKDKKVSVSRRHAKGARHQVVAGK